MRRPAAGVTACGSGRIRAAVCADPLASGRSRTPYTALRAVRDRVRHGRRNEVWRVSEAESRVNHLTFLIIGCAMKVHTALGPGLLESAYLACLIYELRQAGLRVETEVRVPLTYAHVKIDCGFRIDILVEDLVVVELKCVETVLPVHEAQLLTYLKLAKKPYGLMLNFNVLHLKDGITRRANSY